MMEPEPTGKQTRNRGSGANKQPLTEHARKPTRRSAMLTRPAFSLIGDLIDIHLLYSRGSKARPAMFTCHHSAQGPEVAYMTSKKPDKPTHASCRLHTLSLSKISVTWCVA